MENSSALRKQEKSVESKLNELIFLLNNGEINSNGIKFTDKTNIEVGTQLSEPELIAEFKKVDDDELTRLEKLDKIDLILQSNFIDTKVVKSIAIKRYSEFIIQGLIGIVMLTLGFAMIILPSPAYFEMFTIFHFTTNDGFTLMDLISLIVILTGVFLIIKGYFKFAEQY
ncbi:hypothetical protein A5893_07715 [Pedobacter psychrophilus]|uniref:Uncharacterized protein n=1 Tax=Pedobacter psychrophilus TaxID=1826909 RepID=A0A179DIW4_9SPHI|nr:hypothetical protein [Pedobacter psychrophilus]OAQ40814.1 hypothetical protein A5893_07715 [Pedobacter psychrophilus]